MVLRANPGQLQAWERGLFVDGCPRPERANGWVTGIQVSDFGAVAFQVGFGLKGAA